MRFLVDAMLGKLARWLRLLGYDAEYGRDASDDELLERARSEDRLLLTSDVELFRRALHSGVKAFLVKGSTEEERLAQLASKLGVKLEVDLKRSRCPKCNSPVVEVPKEAVRGLVPEGSWSRYDRFWRCTGCGQVYWQGSHWANIEAVLSRARKLASRAR
ncbi:hypothetical protein B6U66_02280 [Candidatus Bathyarchaeota archaeon ex4484_135]|nr:MAG: hypothetical protein B6U66_02280 [Candidatus Bathyarchaeota archaeon ex4484_135]